MNDHEFEELLRRAPVSADNNDDIKLRLLSRLAQPDSPRRLEGRVRSWRRIAVTGWVVAGLAVFAAVLPSNHPTGDQLAIGPEASLAGEESPDGHASEELAFQIDAAEQTGQFKHPWSSTVILLADLPFEQRETLPVHGRFQTPLPQ